MKLLKRAAQPQSGNAAWKASRWMSKAKPGSLNRRQCHVIRKNGLKCKRWAIRGSTVCYQHGGQMIIGRRNMRRRHKLRHAAWTNAEATSNSH
jgi:hypothetical protein